MFSRFGTVQTCIVNKDKRHAFVKMLTRKDAVSAKEATEDSRKLELPLRVGTTNRLDMFEHRLTMTTDSMGCWIRS